MMLAALLAAPLSCCVAQPRRDDGDEDDDAEAVIFVLSAHMPDVGPHVDSHALEESEMDWEQAEAPWLQWGVPTVAWLAPFYGATSYGSKGGLCTQALLASLRQRDRGQSFFELLTTMRRVFDRAGLVSAVLTLRSSMKSIPDVRGGSARVGARASAPSCSVARAFPSASELERAPKAVLVGICYEDSPKWKLEGSWNDILDMKERPSVSWLTAQTATLYRRAPASSSSSSGSATKRITRSQDRGLTSALALVACSTFAATVLRATSYRAIGAWLGCCLAALWQKPWCVQDEGARILPSLAS